MKSQDEKYMQVALKLAQRGIGSVEPNPAVGCVIVKQNQIVGKGWHKKFGGPHAEINALNDCKTLGVNPQGATMYVTLEPCCHKGKTQPCTDAIIESGLATVIVATVDPSEHASGRGIEQLRSASIEVQSGICENEAKILNAPFIKYATTGKCWIVLKWAQTIDGKLAWVNEQDKRKWISSELSRKDMHKLRRRVSAILVGIETVLADDPMLTGRPSRGKQAARIVLDNRLRIPGHSKLIRTAKKTPVIILAWQGAVQTNEQIVQRLEQAGAEILAYPDTQGRSNLYFLLDELSNRGITQLLVEGGPRVIASFLRENLADEFCIYIAPKILGSQGGAGMSPSIEELVKSFGLDYVDIKRFGDDVRITGFSEKALNDLSITQE